MTNATAFQSDRKRVVVWTGSFLPGSRAGGPIRSLDALTYAHDAKIQFFIVTGDRDLGDRRPYQTVAVSKWSQDENRSVWYWSKYDARATIRLVRSIRELDPAAHYFNSLWSWRYTLLPLLLMATGLIRRTPVLVAPRGETLAGALTSKSAKKGLAMPAVRFLLHVNRATLQATSIMERESFKKHFPKRQIVDIPDLFKSTKSEFTPRRPTPELKLVSVARIHPHKNLLGTIRALSQCSGPVNLRVVGGVEDAAYFDECVKAAKVLPNNASVDFLGHCDHDEIDGNLRWADAFISATKSENFGHSIREALSAGCIPLISDQTPWSGIVRDVGLTCPAWSDDDAFTLLIDAMAMTESSERSDLGRKVHARYLSWAEEQESHREAAVEYFVRLPKRGQPT